MAAAAKPLSSSSSDSDHHNLRDYLQEASNWVGLPFPTTPFTFFIISFFIYLNLYFNVLESKPTSKTHRFPTSNLFFLVVFATSFRFPSIRLVNNPYMRLRRPRGSLQDRQNLIQGTVIGLDLLCCLSRLLLIIRYKLKSNLLVKTEIKFYNLTVRSGMWSNGIIYRTDVDN